MGQIPQQIKQGTQQAGEVLGPIARQTGRFLYSPGDIQSISAENRYVPPNSDWPIQDYGYQTPQAKPPKQWWKQNPGADRTGSP